jgi:hypothetical protein
MHRSSRTCSLWLLAVLSLAGSAPPAWAVTIVLKNSDTPLRGYPVSENESVVVIKILEADGKLVERSIPRAEIDLIHYPVSRERLESLHPDRPKEYRDYAEELAEKRIDPEARETSLRLYVIAAYLDPQKLGRSSLLGMTALARNAHEERRIRALAFLQDAEHDRQILAPPTPPPADPQMPNEFSDELQKMSLLRALEMLRKGQQIDALSTVHRPGVPELLGKYAEHLTMDQFHEACADRQRRGPGAPRELALRILRIEMDLLGAGPDVLGHAADQGLTGWSAISPEALARPTRPLTLDAVTHFDPRQCLYRDGTWQAADKE